MGLSRRDWLRSILGASLAHAVLPYGCGSRESSSRAREPIAFEGELRGPSFERGHALLRPQGEPSSPEVEREHDVIIVGGGVAGLSAARALGRHGIDDVVLFELESEVGGTSFGGATHGMPHPWGAHYLPVPSADNTGLLALLEEMGVTRRGADGAPVFDEARLVREPEERLYYRGYWYQGLYPGAGQTRAERDEHLRFEEEMRAWARRRGQDGRPAFAIPLDLSSRDPEILALDRVSAAAWLTSRGYKSARVRWFCDYACRDDFGLTLAQTSAWALLHYYAARIDARGESAALLTWPEGNFALVRHLRDRVGRARIRCGELVHRIVDEGDRVAIDTQQISNPQGQPAPIRRIRARRVIVATPRFIARKLLPDLPALDAPFGSWIVANLALTERPSSPGFPAAWDNVLYDSPSLGYVVSTHGTGRDHGPTVWTYYLPLTDDDPRAARRTLLEHTLPHWQDAIVSDLSRAHDGLPERITRIDVCRWGHAMVQPRVGALFSGSRLAAQTPRGRVHFAHSDLSGIALFEEAFHQGARAADEVARAEGKA